MAFSLTPRLLSCRSSWNLMGSDAMVGMLSCAGLRVDGDKKQPTYQKSGFLNNRSKPASRGNQKRRRDGRVLIEGKRWKDGSRKSINFRRKKNNQRTRKKRRGQLRREFNSEREREKVTKQLRLFPR